jgi:hypothetical protein
MANQGSVTRAIRSFVEHRRGNVAILGAASILPLMGMLGGAMEVSRLYLVKARLQQACDTGVLGGRRAMGGGTWNEDANLLGHQYFAVNFPEGRYGAQNVRVDFKVGTDQIVHGAAKLTLPMVIMQVFGFGSKFMAADCAAKLELPNADVMFVLDTTLSMTEANDGDTLPRIQVLRNSVSSFFSTLEKARGPGTRVRYGFVPYSSTVNVGTLLKPEWVTDRWTYQSREAAGTGTKTNTDTARYRYELTPYTYTGSVQTRKYTIPPENCTAPANVKYTSKTTTDPSPVPPDGEVTYTETVTKNGTTYSASLSGSTCTVTENVYQDYAQTTTVRRLYNPNYGNTSESTVYYWNYLARTYDLTSLKTMASQSAMALGSLPDQQIGANHAAKPIPWRGCIEERQTSAANDALKPTALSDLDVDGEPVTGDPGSQWRPALPDLIYARKWNDLNSATNGTWTVPTVSNVTNNYDSPTASAAKAALRAACPTAARKLAAISKSELDSYLASLAPAGLTYHDIGFLWGLRLLSAQGIFKNENVAPSGGKVSRHLIFMTDGKTETNINDYDAYGLAALDRRRSNAGGLPTNSDQNAMVERRLSGLCTVAKNKGITVWVIAFGTDLIPLLTGCASDGRAYQAKSASELDQAFAQIAAQISQLRLTR